MTIKPSKSEMQKVFERWDKTSEVSNYDKESVALNKLFQKHKYNTNLNEVIIKVACLNAFYGTNATMYAKVPQIAEKIISIKDFDKRVQKWDEKLVIELAKFPKANLYSFASKYCVLHNYDVYEQNDYVIFDSIVCKKLREFKKAYPKYSFAKFTEKDFTLENYPKYKEILQTFSREFGLGENLRELDWYLWKLGKLEKLDKKR